MATTKHRYAYSIYDLIAHLRWRSWKRRVGRALREGKSTETCISCSDPIFPGDFVAIVSCPKETGEYKVRLEHAGIHFTMREYRAFCTTAAVGRGYWDGYTVRNTGEKEAKKALCAGKTQSLP